jgi:hypothetical protein
MTPRGRGDRHDCRLVAAKPETSHDNFLRDFGERFVPGYKAVSTVLLMNAPFDEQLAPQDDPISRPVTNTKTPPRPTCTAAVSGGVSMYRCRIQLIASSSITTTATATTSAA